MNQANNFSLALLWKRHIREAINTIGLSVTSVRKQDWKKLSYACGPGHKWKTLKGYGVAATRAPAILWRNGHQWNLYLTYGNVHVSVLIFAVWSRELKPGALLQPKGVGWGGRWEKGGSTGTGHMYTYSWFLLMFSRKQHNIAKQLSPN